MFVALSFFVLVVPLSGYLILHRVIGEQRGFSLQRLASYQCAGLLSLLTVFLVLRNLFATAIIFSIMSVCGLAVLLKHGRLKDLRSCLPDTIVPTFLIGVAFLKILSDPLQEWDARSIWFFHARIIFHSAPFFERAELMHPSTFFSHPDYPKLVPLLGALSGRLAGYWNEFLPKLALCALIVPIGCFLAAEVRRSPHRGFALLFLPLLVGPLMSNGYMDGYLALYCALGLLHSEYYFLDRRLNDLVAALVSLGIAASLKNEGIVFAILTILVYSMAHLIERRRSRSDLWPGRRWPTRESCAAAIAFAPALAWGVLKRAWSVESDLQLGSTASLDRLALRLTDGVSLERIVSATSSLDTVLGKVAILSCLAILCARLLRQLHSLQSLLPLVSVCALYYLALVAIYLATPNPLPWHLATSADRTALTVVLGALMGMYLAFQPRERLAASPEAHRGA